MQGNNQPPNVLQGPFPPALGCFQLALGKRPPVSPPNALTSFPNFQGSLWLLHQSKEEGAERVTNNCYCQGQPHWASSDSCGCFCELFGVPKEALLGMFPL